MGSKIPAQDTSQPPPPPPPSKGTEYFFAQSSLQEILEISPQLKILSYEEQDSNSLKGKNRILLSSDFLTREKFLVFLTRGADAHSSKVPYKKNRILLCTKILSRGAG
jgi:hypothetical protein